MATPTPASQAAHARWAAMSPEQQTAHIDGMIRPRQLAQARRQVAAWRSDTSRLTGDDLHSLAIQLVEGLS